MLPMRPKPLLGRPVRTDADSDGMKRGDGGGMMHHWDGGWGVGNWLLMGFGMLLFWALVVAGIVWLVQYATNRPTSGEYRVSLDKSTSSARPNAREILDERYARGEISDEEYRTRRGTLTSG